MNAPIAWHGPVHRRRTRHSRRHTHIHLEKERDDRLAAADRRRRLRHIALADLVPSLHHSRGRWAAVIQLTLIVLGVATIYFTGELLPH